MGTLHSCPEEFTGYCMDGSYCFYLEEQQTAACKCPDLHVGKRCEKSILYPIIQVENVHIETAIENLK